MEEEVKSFPRINQDNFDSDRLLNHKNKTVVIFSADWCPYCVSFFNNWSEYGRADDVCIADITDVESELWDSFDIEVVPTMVVFENGVLVKRWDGQLQRGLTIDQIQSVNDYLADS
jgi:thioredoxin-like negative regulator of GroEL